jgi:hypothetical protein
MTAEPGTVAYQFRAFIEQERDRFDTRENNLFAAAFNDVWVYRWFLDVVAGRYAPLGPQYEQALRAHWGESRKSSGGPATSDVMLSHARMSHLELLARLEIETFYLLAGVLLERVATGLGFYFEGRTDNDWRHSGMTSTAFGPYADEHHLSLPDQFLSLADSLKVKVLDFRNQQIVHEGNVRATRGTGLRTGQGPSISIATLYPTKEEMDPERYAQTSDPIEALRREGMESRPIPELLATIDAYLAAVMELIELNRESTPLMLDAGRRG